MEAEGGARELACGPVGVVVRRGSVGVSALKGVGRLSWMLSAVGPRRNGMTEGDNGSGDEARDRRKKGPRRNGTVSSRGGR